MTLPQTVKAIKRLDPQTAINESMLTTLIDSGCLPSNRHGNRLITDFDLVIPCMNRMLGIESNDRIPHVRTIRGVVRELHNTYPDLGIGETHIRAAVECGRLDAIRVGNRAYLCMEQFEEPYVQRLSDVVCTHTEPKPKHSNSASAQIGSLLSGNTGIPSVKRVRKGQ